MNKLGMVLALFAFHAPAWATPTSADYAAAIEAEKRGAEMLAYDQAAWHATDRFQEDLQRKGSDLGSYATQGLRGYIVEPEEGGTLLTTFFGERDGLRFAIARYHVAGSKVTSGGLVASNDSSAISSLAKRMIEAREQAIQMMGRPDHELCSQSNANSLVLPPRENGIMPVYILSSTVVDGIYPAGGHYRFDFDKNGTFVSERRFMKGCFDVDFRAKDGVRPEIMFITHLLDPQPTEIHAFVSLNVPIGIAVVTVSNRALWAVSRGRIQYVQDIEDKK